MGYASRVCFEFSSAEVIYVDDSDNTPYSQQYLVDTSTMSRAYQCPPKATESPNIMFIWTLSRYWRCFLMGFPLGGLEMVSNEPIIDGRRPEFTRLALVAAVRCF